MRTNPDQALTGPEYSQYSARLVLAYQYGALAFAGAGLAWAIVFAAIGWWWVVALDMIIVASGLAIYVLIRRGHFTFGLMAAQSALIVIAIVMGLLIDVPTEDAPRVSHLYLLVVAALGYLNYQRVKLAEQLALIAVCLLAFVVLSTMTLANPFQVDLPDDLRSAGTWANAIAATAMLAACIHVMHVGFVRKDKLSRELMSAMLNGEFQLVYQRQVGRDCKTTGAEALLRWNSPNRGSVPPAEFIPQAEQLGLMNSIGSWVLEKGCETLCKWSRNAECQHLTLSINVSASQLVDANFENVVQDMLQKSGADPRKLTLELTESTLVTDIELVRAKLERLNGLGITIALDDFGTGYSSLSYLRHLPIQQIKIDRGFVQDAVKTAHAVALIKNVIQIGRDLQKDVLAEGVETMAQHELLVALECVQFQGYLYGRPSALQDFERKLQDEAAGPSSKFPAGGAPP